MALHAAKYFPRRWSLILCRLAALVSCADPYQSARLGSGWGWLPVATRQAEVVMMMMMIIVEVMPTHQTSALTQPKAAVFETQLEEAHMCRRLIRTPSIAASASFASFTSWLTSQTRSLW